MASSTADRLKARGLDTDFLCWLEGEADRLPRRDAVRKLKAEQLMAAVRAAVWLRQLRGHHTPIGPVVEPASREAWENRYYLLEVFLLEAVKSTFFFSMFRQHDDLEALERVLLTLLPESCSVVYKADILYLRRKGYPQTLPFSRDSLPRRRSGGKPESEQTERMRAAIAYVQSVSETAFDDLADFWNECAKSSTVYQPDAIRSRLRKGHFWHRRPEAAKDFLEHWFHIYHGDLKGVYPVPFPLSRELREAYGIE
jgi:hypothetical protein